VADKVPEELQRRRRARVEELAKDLFMSTCGVMFQDVPLFGPVHPESAADRQKSMPSSVNILPSTPTKREITSSPPATPSYSAPDAAFQRLRLLCPSLRAGKLGDVKQASILSFWPTERGVDTKDYVSSIVLANDKQFDEARERLRKREAKRKAQEKFKRPAFMRQGLPSEERRKGGELGTQPGPAQVLSSQLVPPSSQIQGPQVTMSQPVAGVFGDRKKVKKGKKKSGFR
jgi:RNA polymerase I-specific transcription initiation factor RRN6